MASERRARADGAVVPRIRRIATDWLFVGQPLRRSRTPCSEHDRAFARFGLVRKRKKRTKVEPQTQPFANCDAPNDLWCTDFKGHARMDDRRKSYPLTLMDAPTRFMFACEGLHDPNGARVKEIYERVFEEFGLPRTIRSDDSSEARIAGESSMPTTDHRLRRGHQRAFQRCRCGGSSLEFDTSASTRGSPSRTGGSRDSIARSSCKR